MSAAKSTKKSVTNRAVPVALTAESLAGVQVFRRLSAPNRGKLAALCQGRRYAAQQRVLSHKDGSQDVYFIISGKVRVTIYSLGGKEITFRDQAAGEMFGELGAIDGEPRSAHVMALEDSLLASMSREKFWGVLGQEFVLSAEEFPDSFAGGTIPRIRLAKLQPRARRQVCEFIDQELFFALYVAVDHRTYHGRGNKTPLVISQCALGYKTSHCLYPSTRAIGPHWRR